MTARFRCWSCRHEWQAPAGPQNGCPACGHLYMTWLNFYEMKRGKVGPAWGLPLPAADKRQKSGLIGAEPRHDSRTVPPERGSETRMLPLERVA